MYSLTQFCTLVMADHLIGGGIIVLMLFDLWLGQFDESKFCEWIAVICETMKQVQTTKIQHYETLVTRLPMVSVQQVF